VSFIDFICIKIAAFTIELNNFKIDTVQNFNL